MEENIQKIFDNNIKQSYKITILNISLILIIMIILHFIRGLDIFMIKGYPVKILRYTFLSITLVILLVNHYISKIKLNLQHYKIELKNKSNPSEKDILAIREHFRKYKLVYLLSFAIANFGFILLLIGDQFIFMYIFVLIAILSFLVYRPRAIWEVNSTSKCTT